MADHPSRRRTRSRVAWFEFIHINGVPGAFVDLSSLLKHIAISGLSWWKLCAPSSATRLSQSRHSTEHNSRMPTQWALSHYLVLGYCKEHSTCSSSAPCLPGP